MRPAPLLLALLAVLAGLVLAPGASAATGDCDGAREPCLETAGTPRSVTVPTALAPSSVSYTTTLVNGGTSTLSHVVLTDALPEGTTPIGPVSTSGTCATSGRIVTCTVGNLAAGKSVTITVTASVSTAVGPGELRNVVTATFEAGANPGGDPKRTLQGESLTTLLASDGVGTSWLSANVVGLLATDPTTDASAQRTGVAQAKIPATASGLSGLLRARVPGPFTCPRREVCRAGGWFEANIPGTFSDDPLRFTLRFDKSIIPAKQTVRNFNVYHAPKPGDPLETMSARCTSLDKPTTVPCVQVTKESDGDYTAVVLRETNGYMR